MIRFFINNKTLNKEDQLDAHPSECMCLNNLLYNKENKIAIIDKTNKNVTIIIQIVVISYLILSVLK